MTRLADLIPTLDLKPGNLALIWLGQAGFVIKTSANEVVYIDAYLSNMCEYLPGGGVMSKRLIPSPLDIQEIRSGLMAFTHRHQDHMDDEAITQIFLSTLEVQFAGPRSCTKALKDELGVPEERIHLLKPGEPIHFKSVSLRAVMADHGESEPDAIGIVVEAEGKRIYHTGDTCYCPEKMEEVISLQPDVLLPCINGTYGNLNGIEAARLAQDVGAKFTVPCHYWFFVGQNLIAEGTPAAFLDACKTYAPRTQPVIPAIGQPFIV